MENHGCLEFDDSPVARFLYFGRGEKLPKPIGFAACPWFAGPDNFAPVLVGSLGGALFGCSDALLKGLCSDLWPAETIEGILD